MAVYFMNNNQRVIKLVGYEALREDTQTQELPDDGSLLKDMLTVSAMNDERLDDAQYMAVESYTGNKQSFDMYRIVNQRTEQNWTTFDGVQLAYYELDGSVVEDIRPKNAYINEFVPRLLKGTDWRLGYVDDNLPRVNTHIYYLSVKDALAKVQSVTGVEIIFKVEISGNQVTDKWVEVYERLGDKTLKRFNYGTNALTVVRETSHQDLYTALIGRGKGEEVSSAEDNQSGQAGYGRKITFRDVEWSKAKGKPLDKPKGQLFLEQPEATAAYGIQALNGEKLPRVGIVEFSDTEDPNVLIQQTYEALEYYARPKVLFKASVVNIGATGIGDTVTIHRHDLNIHYQTRVRKVIRDKINDNRTQVELGDVVHTSSTKKQANINSALNNLNDTIRDTARNEILPSLPSANGVNQNFYQNEEPERKRTGDLWYRDHPSLAGHRQLLMWNGEAWELLSDTSDKEQVNRRVDEQEELLEKYSQDLTTTTELANNVSEKAAQLEQSYQDVKASTDGAISKLTDDLNTKTSELTNVLNTKTAELEQNYQDVKASTDSAMNKAVDAYTDAQNALASIDGMVYENRNFLKNSNDFSIFKPYANSSIEYQENQSIEEADISEGTRLIISDGTESLKTTPSISVGSDYKGDLTYSFWAKNNGDEPVRFRINGFVQDDGAGSVNEILEPNEARRIIVHGRMRDDYDWFQHQIYQTQDEQTIDVTLAQMKLEKGTKATPYSVAPEDLNEEIANAWNQAHQALENIDTLDQSVQLEFENIDGRLSSKAEQTTVNELDRTVQNQGSELLQAQDMIALKADRTDVDTLNEIIETNSAELSVLADEISSKVDRQTVDNLNQTVETLSAEQIIQADMISKRLTRSEVNAEIERRVNDMAGGEFNLEGYAEVEYVENLIENTADSFSQSIENVRKLVPSNYENRNLVMDSNRFVWTPWATRGIDPHSVNVIEKFNLTGNGFLFNIPNESSQSGQLRAYVPLENFTSKPLEQGENYTFSVYVRNLREHPIRLRLNGIQDSNGNTVDHWLSGHDEERVILKGERNSRPLQFQVYAHSAGYNVQAVFAQMQLEKGLVATDWSSAPEDLENEVTRQGSEISMLKNEISLKTDKESVRQIVDGDLNPIRSLVQTNKSELKLLEGQISSKVDSTEYIRDKDGIINDISSTKSEVKQLSDSFNVEIEKVDKKIDSIEVGGRNLLPKFTDERWSGSGKRPSYFEDDYTIVFPSGVISAIEIELELEKNTDYVLQFNTDYMRFFLDIKDNDGSYSSFKYNSVGSEVVKFNTEENTEYRFRINTWSENLDKERRAWKPKLEKGTIATDWSPAPEDLQNEVTVLRSDYKRTAEEITDRLTKIDGSNGYINEIKRDVGSLTNSITEYEEGTAKRFNLIESDVNSNRSLIADLEKDTESRFSQTEEEMSLLVRSSDLISEINLQADRQIFRVGDNRLMITEDTTYLDNAVVKSAHIADLAVTGAKIADASISSAKIINLDADRITGNTTNFIQSNWNNISTQISIDDRGINITGNDRWRRTYFNQTGFELFNGSGAYNKAGVIGYFKPNTDIADAYENVMLSERSGTPRHIIGMAVNNTHDLALGFNTKTTTSRVFSPALEVRGNTGDVDISTRLIMKNGGSIFDVNTLIYNQLNTEIGTWDGSLTYRANRHHRFFSSNNQELFNVLDNGYANLYARLNMNGNDVYNQSDERLKRNIMPSFKDSLGKFSKLEFKWYEYLENRGLADGLHHGLIAQDVVKFAPEWVIEDEQGYYSLNQTAMLMDAFKAIMQLSQKVKKLEAK